MNARGSAAEAAEANENFRPAAMSAFQVSKGSKDSDRNRAVYLRLPHLRPVEMNSCDGATGRAPVFSVAASSFYAGEVSRYFPLLRRVNIFLF